MIKQGLKNYLKNLKYFFTPLGTIALGVVFGLSLGIPIVLNSLSNLIDMIVKISENTQIQLRDLINGIWERIDALNWGEPLKALGTIFDRGWLTDAVNNCLNSISLDVSKLENYINSCIDNIEFAFKIFILFSILGFIGGYFLTKWLIRREIAKRALWKYFLKSFVDSLLSATLVSCCIWILIIWKPSIFISTLIALTLFGFIQLLEAYIIHAWKKVEVKKVINLKNIAKLFCSDILIFVLATVLVGIVIAITNTLVGLFVGIALIAIAFIVIELNAEAYVKSVAGVGKTIVVEKLDGKEAQTVADKK